MRNQLRRALCCGLLATVVVVAAGDAASPAPDAKAGGLLQKVKVPPEFEVTVFAQPPEIGYPTCLAASGAGELFVGVDENGSLDAKPKRGRVVRCLDTDGDGRGDRFNVFAEMDSPRGLFFDHGTLYVMHPPLLEAFIDEDGDGTADRSEILVKGLGFDLKFRGADHTVNGMGMGIDGFLYIAVGDYGAIQAEGKDGRRLQLHGGGVVRVRLNGSGLELVSRGQRNIYDVAISPELDLFTRDNTNDGGGWDVRLSHVILTGQYGYPTLFKNFPDEIVQPLADYGGGSPCGSLYLDEPGFPKDMGTALYTCEWGRSMVYRHPLDAAGAGFKARQVPFVEIPRPTDMETDGLGRLYISSWSNGGFTYSGPNVGFVIRLAPKAGAAAGLASVPELAKAPEERLLQWLGSPSGTLRLHTQREILRRAASPGLVRGLEKLASSGASLPARVAAVFTLNQLPARARLQPILLRLAKPGALREFALRALADDPNALPRTPVKPFLDALADENPRVRLQAVIGLGRLGLGAAGATASAGRLLGLTTDADPLVSHAAVQALSSLQAAEVCLAALDSPGSAGLVPGAVRVLQSMHDERVVQGLLERLATATDDSVRRPIVKALCRLYQREADWDGKWWGTRPDTSGPYFRAVTWSASERIAAVLQQQLSGADAGTLRWLVVELQRHKVDLPGLTSLVLDLANQDQAFRSTAVDLLGNRSTVPEQAVPLLGLVARSRQEPPALRAKAIRALLQVAPASAAARDAAMDALSTQDDTLPDELAGAWDEFVRDPKHGREVAFFVELAETGAPGKGRLAYGVLIQLANRRFSSRETKAEATRAIEKAWTTPASAVQLLYAIAQLRADQYAHQVRALAGDGRPGIGKAAAFAADRLGLKAEPGQTAGQVLIESLPYDQVVAAAAKEPGEPKAGRELFLKQGCVACHTVSATEPLKGPFLGGIAARYNRSELCESILKPGAKVAQGFETQWFTTRDGDEIEGFVVREAGDEIEVRNVQGISTMLARSSIKERGRRETSAMPIGLADKLTPAQLASLLAYLESLPAQ